MIPVRTIKFRDILALLVLLSIIIHSYVKGIDMTETYKAIAMSIVFYYFGSSQSSALKDETIKDLKDQSTTVKTDTLNTENIENATANKIVTNDHENHE